MKKHIVCLGDSNTHGYCADPGDSAEGGDRFNESERWPKVLASLLGEDYLVIEEGLNGRTTVFPDPLQEGLSAVDVVYPILMSHKPIDLLIVMLGTNDTKLYFSANAAVIAMGMDRLLTKIRTTPCWGEKQPNILVICPPHIGEGIKNHEFYPSMGAECIQKSRELSKYMEPVARAHSCAWLDAQGVAEFNRLDCMHLTRKGHSDLAHRLAEIVPELI